MPVTARKLLIRNITGVGKKSSTTLRYDHVKKQIVNSKCNCKSSSCIGVFFTNQPLFGNVTCNGSTCITQNNSLIQIQINAIPGTSVTIPAPITSGVSLVNCTNSLVTWASDQDPFPNFNTILPNYAVINGAPNPNISITYTFT